MMVKSFQSIYTLCYIHLHNIHKYLTSVGFSFTKTKITFSVVSILKLNQIYDQFWF